MKKYLIILLMLSCFTIACEKDYELSKADELDFAFISGDCGYVLSELEGKDLVRGSREENMYISSLMQCSGTSLFSTISNLDNKAAGNKDFFSILKSTLNTDTLTKENINSLRANFDKVAEACKKAKGTDGKYVDPSLALSCAIGESNAASLEVFGPLIELNGNNPVTLSNEGVRQAVQGKTDEEIKSAINNYYSLKNGEEENVNTDRVNDIVKNLDSSLNNSIITDTLNINTDQIKNKLNEAKGPSGRITASSLLKFIKNQK